MGCAEELKGSRILNPKEVFDDIALEGFADNRMISRENHAASWGVLVHHAHALSDNGISGDIASANDCRVRVQDDPFAERRGHAVILPDR